MEAVNQAHIRLLLEADIPACMDLKRQAGWNQTPSDWHALLESGPESCWGVFRHRSLLSTLTTIAHTEQIAWVGMVLTHEMERGRGHATSLLEHALQWIDAKGFPCTKLDATPAGEPLYRKFGFVVESRVERWVREPSEPITPAQPSVPFLLPNAIHQRLAVEAFRADDGYALARPGSDAWYFGPCSFASRDAAVAAVEWHLSRHATDRSFWDLPAANAKAHELASAAGYVRYRTLHRMRRGEPIPDPVNVYAIAGFEFG